MTSISTTAATSVEGDKPVPAGEQVVDKNQKRPARTRKGRGPAIAAPASAKPDADEDGGMATTADDPASARIAEGRTTTADIGKVAAAKSAASGAAKKDVVLKKLRASRGTTIAALMQATGWQAHSVRGFLSGTVRKKLGFTVVSEIGKDGARRYRVAGSA